MFACICMHMYASSYRFAHPTSACDKYTHTHTHTHTHRHVPELTVINNHEHAYKHAVRARIPMCMRVCMYAYVRVGMSVCAHKHTT